MADLFYWMSRFAGFLFYLAITGFIAEKAGDWYDANFKMPGRLRRKTVRVPKVYIRKADKHL